MDWTEILKLRLRNAPKPVKAMALAYLAALSLAYVYAVGNIAMAIGLTPKSIAVHYYGASEKVVESKSASGEEELNLDSVESDKKAEIGARPSFKNLIAEGHFHLFGMSSFFFGMTLLALFTGLSLKVKTWVVSMPFVAVIVDNLSFMVTRFGGPQFAYLTAMAGSLMGICFSVLWIAIVLEIIKKTEVKI